DAAALSAAGVATATATATATSAADLGGGPAQGRADLVDLHLDDGALLTLTGLVRALPEPARHDHPGAAGEALGDVLRRLAPHRAVHEERFAVFPLVGVAVE